MKHKLVTVHVYFIQCNAVFLKVLTSAKPWINLATKTMIGLYFMENARITKHDALIKIAPPNILKILKYGILYSKQKSLELILIKLVSFDWSGMGHLSMLMWINAFTV